MSTYLPRYKTNPNRVSPENNIDCPLGELGLLDILGRDKKNYKKAMLVFMHKISYMLFMVDYGEYVNRSQLQDFKGKDSITDNVVMHIAEVAAMYNCKLDYFLREEHVVIISMIDDCISHENIDKMLQVIFALTECSYDILVCYDEKVRYAASNTDRGMVCNVFGKIKQ